MATQHPGLRKIGDYWHYELKVNGLRQHGSTKAKDLATARMVLEERRKDILRHQCGIVKVPTLATLVKQWLKQHASVHSAKHCGQVERFCRIWILPSLGTKKIDQIRTEDVVAIRTKLIQAGKSPVTVNEALKILKLVCRYAVRLGYLHALPFHAPFLKVQRRPRPTVPALRLQEFLGAVDLTARNPQVGVIIRVMLGLGLREAEALGMRWEWFDPDRRTYTVGRSKNKNARILPVPDWLWSAIYVMPQAISEWVFPAIDGKPHRPQFTKKALERVCLRLGLGHITQHRLRATFASLHAQAGTPITEIQGMLGHKNVATTMIYVETSLDAKRRSQDALSERLGFTTGAPAKAV